MRVYYIKLYFLFIFFSLLLFDFLAAPNLSDVLFRNDDFNKVAKKSKSKREKENKK